MEGELDIEELEQWENYQEQTLQEVNEQLASQDTLIKEGVVYVEFVSTSNGRGRKRRKKPREVSLVTWRGKTVSLGERMTKRVQSLMENVFPEERDSDKWLENFKEALIQSVKKRKYPAR